jgi:hypothetical protein
MDGVSFHDALDISTGVAHRHRANVLVSNRVADDDQLVAIVRAALEALARDRSVPLPPGARGPGGGAVADVAFVFAYDRLDLLGTGQTIARGQYISHTLDGRWHPATLPGGRERQQDGDYLVVLDRPA